ncbi:GRAS family transcription factor [Hibiscus syriacus]|uniref:GRAS family transcription factor n=1 Tax=Hibiscus syriacus TaxID=106335 RepID=A0A6A2YZZ1_HIBSY|nr:uncharacterized protein LOC120154314 [Hibiscus syriacus]KAE8684492.1 GRAS family transcription factor [Hibiscus syriacus]
MTGIGGPLLTIGDLLSDDGEESGEALEHHPRRDAALPLQSVLDSVDASSQSLDLIKLSQENFEKLKVALEGSDHSWTALTFELCTALETANKFVQSTDTNVRLLSEKVREVERIIKRGDSAVTAARAISISLKRGGGSSVSSQNREIPRSP